MQNNGGVYLGNSPTQELIAQGHPEPLFIVSIAWVPAQLDAALAS